MMRRSIATIASEKDRHNRQEQEKKSHLECSACSQDLNLPASLLQLSKIRTIMGVEMAAEYSTIDGVIGLIVLMAYLVIVTLGCMFSSTALIYSEWMGGKMRYPLLSFISVMLHPLLTLWGNEKFV
ncbi:hypothetical protein Ocin01_08102 [Orchesella cincta]|uniref:Uncharacterized protein n=1 Tax=Orchesella cincta TaxID=48709 RepID=A0A1D2N0J0_ORCCI|nr:hypothetical protein Ocin01_08102 [Orchesella cincta]